MNYLKEKEEGLQDLKIATIFSYTANEYKESMGFVDEHDGGMINTVETN